MIRMNTASIHPPKYPGGKSDKDADDRADDGGTYGNDHGNTGAVDDTGQDITAKVICAEKMSGSADSLKRQDRVDRVRVIWRDERGKYSDDYHKSYDEEANEGCFVSR